MTTNDFLALVSNVKQNSNGWWDCRCPAHDDRHASLGVKSGDKGIILKCQAGCDASSVCSALGLKLSDLFFEQKKVKPEIVATYDYREADGTLLFQAVRFEPKDFRQRRPMANGGWEWSLNGTPRVLYRLPELTEAPPEDPILIVEGEKDADNLVKMGFYATTCPMGAGKWDKLRDYEVLSGHPIVIIQDKDKPGREHAQDVSERLTGLVPSISIIELPGAHVKDASDWISAGGTAEALVDLISAVEPVSEPLKRGPVLVRMCDIDPREVMWLWEKRIPMGRISVIAGIPGVGKSFITTDLASRVSTGTPWPDGSLCERGSVIFITAEDDPADTIRPRLDAHRADCSKIHLLAMVRRPGEDGKLREFMFSLDDVVSLEQALAAVPDCKLVIVDPVGSFIGGNTKTSLDNEVRAVLAPVNKLAERYGAAVALIAHLRKEGGTNADDLVMGSRAFTGLARSVWHIVWDKDDQERRLFLAGKNNLAKRQDGLAFTIVGQPAAIQWEKKAVEMSANDQIAAQRGPDPTSRKEAGEWLKNHLSDMAEHPVNEVTKAAEEEGISWRTLYRAKDEIGVIGHKAQFGGKSIWRLPKP